MDQQQLKNSIESILFVSSKPLTIKDLSKLLEQEPKVVMDALESLANDRKDSGIVLLNNNDQYQLATNSHNSTAVKNFLNAELREKLTDATVEVLAIIAYRQPIAKAEIEAIRGVNSQYSLRALLMRGLIEKIPNPNDARGVLYQTTTEFLQHLGIVSTKDLPEFEKLVADIKLPETPALQPTTDITPDQPEKAAETESQPAEEQQVILAVEMESSPGSAETQINAEPTDKTADDEIEDDEFDEDEDDDEEDEDGE